jgi:hypothetical protein
VALASLSSRVAQTTRDLTVAILVTQATLMRGLTEGGHVSR